MIKHFFYVVESESVNSWPVVMAIRRGNSQPQTGIRLNLVVTGRVLGRRSATMG